MLYIVVVTEVHCPRGDLLCYSTGDLLCYCGDYWSALLSLSS